VTIRKGLPAKLALTDANDTRYLFSGLVVCNVDGSPRGGVLSPVNVNLVTSSATMNVSVARFQGAAVRDGGIILLANDGAANVLLDAAPGANSRIDVIYAKQNDASGTVTVPDANNTSLLTFVKGTAGAVPVKPTLPVGALELATVLIPSGATATNSAGVVITQTAEFTASSGGTVSFRTKTAMDAVTTLVYGSSAVVLADGARYVRGSSTWVSTLAAFSATDATVSGSSTPSGVTFAPLPTIPLSLSITAASACKALVTLQCTTTVVAGFMSVGVAVSGATTLTAGEAAPGVFPPSAILTPAVATGVPGSAKKLVSLNAGVNTFTVQSLLGGAGGTKTVNNPYLIVQAVA
jgi:hypothetical protein